MEAFLVSTGLVALAEIGDKTQLLSLVLAARFRRPWPIVLGILASTLVNHALAGAVGAWLNHVVGPTWMARAVACAPPYRSYEMTSTSRSASDPPFTVISATSPMPRT